MPLQKKIPFPEVLDQPIPEIKIHHKSSFIDAINNI